MALIQVLTTFLGLSAFFIFNSGSITGQGIPAGECKNCDDAMKSVFEKAANVIVNTGLEPLVIEDLGICKELRVTGLSTILPVPNACILSNDQELWQQFGLKFGKLHVECTLKPLDQVAKIWGISLPTIPSIDIKLPLFGSVSSSPNTIVIDTKNFSLDIVSKLNFEDGQFLITQAELGSGALDSFSLSLKGNSPFTKLGQLITQSDVVKASLGYVLQIALNQILVEVLNTESLKAFLAMLNCDGA